ncbi:helix-turn-helix domain-containing protein [Aureivirga marina]|uniref:helix-turn-helix domain-containing protein n=1 Tax=Aureivirga marina TaxID=1182451 RepID=UPI0018C9D6D3|nr:helix-turn-helix transcriptional regulator [Aureivirga marina]
MTKLRLREVLKEKKVSFEKLMELMELKGNSITRATISNIVNKKNSPKLETLENIADALNINLVDLFEQEIEEEKRPFGVISYDGVEYVIKSEEDLKELMKKF